MSETNVKPAEPDRYLILSKEAKKRGFNSIADAMNNHDFFYWVQRLKKTNKNYKSK